MASCCCMLNIYISYIFLMVVVVQTKIALKLYNVVVVCLFVDSKLLLLWVWDIYIYILLLVSVGSLSFGCCNASHFLILLLFSVCFGMHFAIQNSKSSLSCYIYIISLQYLLLLFYFCQHQICSFLCVVSVMGNIYISTVESLSLYVLSLSLKDGQ